MSDKQKIADLFTDHLKTFGYPNIKPQIVFDELLTLYKLLDNSGLKPEGLTFQIFEKIAYKKFMQALMNSGN